MIRHRGMSPPGTVSEPGCSMASVRDRPFAHRPSARHHFSARHRTSRPAVGVLISGALIAACLAGCTPGQHTAHGPTASSVRTSPARSSSAPPTTSGGSAPSASATARQPGQTAALVRVHDPGQVTGTLAGPCHARDHGLLPDSRCTPGAIDPAVTQSDISSTICVSGYTAKVRPPESQTEAFKFEHAYHAYDIPSGTVSELDHLVPLELGGANDAANLWPEVGHIPNAKDSVENALHRAVCEGQVTLAGAQRAIASDWETAEYRLGIGPVLSPPVPTTATPAPSAPSGSNSQPLACSASANPVNPADYTTVVVSVSTGSGAHVTTVAHYKTTDHTKTATASSTGHASISYSISGATPGYRVVVTVAVTSGGRSAQCSTSFTPRS